jgi:uncharacterized protein (TIGR04255 family)
VTRLEGNMVSPVFEPINRVHSLVELVLVIEFPGSLPAETIQRASVLKSDLSSILPRVEDVPAFQMIVENGKSRGQMLEGGFQMSSYKPDGSIGAMARVSGNVLSIHWLQYDRWAGARAFVQEVLDRILARVRGGPLDPSSIALKFIDQFVCEAEQDYDAGVLLRQGTGYLPERSFASGSRWHSHTGEFIGEHEGNELLMQLNIDSARHFNDQNARVMVNIDHTLSLRSAGPGALKRFVERSGTGPEWTELLNRLHQNNKSVLKTILQESIQKRIGLAKGAASD